MSKFMIPIFLGILILAAGPAEARKSRVYGSGQLSCANWTEVRETHSTYEYMYIDWLLGFVSGYNAAASDELFGHHPVGDIASGTDLKGTLAWVDQYCTENPLKQISQAGGALITKLWKD